MMSVSLLGRISLYLAAHGLRYQKVAVPCISSFHCRTGVSKSSSHADYFSYYNPVLADFLGNLCPWPKWVIGQHEITRYFADLMKKETWNRLWGSVFWQPKGPEPKAHRCLPEKYYTQIWPFIRRIGGWATIEDLSPDARKTTYFVYPVWMTIPVRKPALNSFTWIPYT